MFQWMHVQILLTFQAHDALLESTSSKPYEESSTQVPEGSDETIKVEADVSNMETSILASPTPTLKIHKDHPKSQIIGPVYTPIQTRHKSKMVEAQSFIATIHQKTDLALL
nr:hypothetical protein [Tanacetum cinerariifolium]